MDDLTVKSHSGQDIYISIDGDGDLAIETERLDGRSDLTFIAAADVPKFCDWLNDKLSDSAEGKP